MFGALPNGKEKPHIFRGLLDSENENQGSENEMPTAIGRFCRDSAKNQPCIINAS